MSCPTPAACVGLGNLLPSLTHFHLELIQIHGFKYHLCLVAQSCPTPCKPKAKQASLSIGILQAGILEWVAMPSSRRSSQPRAWTQVSHTAGGFFTFWAIQFIPQSPSPAPCPCPLLTVHPSISFSFWATSDSGLSSQMYPWLIPFSHIPHQIHQQILEAQNTSEVSPFSSPSLIPY